MTSFLERVTTVLDEAIDKIAAPALLPMVERNLVPDALLRFGIQRMIMTRVHRNRALTAEQVRAESVDFVKAVKSMPVAIHQDAANEQHYEVPAEFYQACLGPCLKYSCGLWTSPNSTFEQSEVDMLELYCQRAQLEDGMRVVDLGCGWGSVSLFIAAKYPHLRVTGISNSNSQREFIMGEAAKRGLSNVEIITADISVFEMDEAKRGTYDRVISIEMFEHMKNYGMLMDKVSSWLKPGGKLFVHAFTSVVVPYHFEDGWMTEKFFSGGTMPGDDTLLYFQEHLKIEDHWRVNGQHYQKTSEAWLRRLDANKARLMPVFERTYGKGNALAWYVNWRLFFMACAEYWGYGNGEEFIVSHYLFAKPL